MKRLVFRILSLGLILLLCTNASAATANPTNTMADRLIRQLERGSGFVGTLTFTATAAQGHEADAFSTVKPIVLDVTMIQGYDHDVATGETRLTFAMNASEYQQASAELALQDNKVYMQSTLLEDGWYLLGENVLDPLLESIGIQGAMPAMDALTQTGDMMPGTLSFFTSMASSWMTGSTAGIDDLTQDYLTQIDFWMEGYSGSVQLKTLDDGTSGMEIDYTIPAADVKAELTVLLAKLMEDEELLEKLAALMPPEQAAQFLNPEQRHYYFYDVDQLPLEGDLTIHRMMTLQGETVELEVSMPLYDSVSGPMTLTYTQRLAGENVPYENTLSISGEGSTLAINYRTNETAQGETAYEGTVLYQGAEENGVKPQTVWAAFTIDSLFSTEDDLMGYTTTRQMFHITLAPAPLSEAVNTAQYAEIPRTDITLDMRFRGVSVLIKGTAPTDVEIALTISGEDMAQSISLVLAGATTNQWTFDAFDPAQATSLADMPAEDLQQLLSQVVIRGGLLFLPYLNLPMIQLDQPME